MQNAFNQNSLDDALKKMPKAQQTTVSENMTSAGRLDKMLGSNSPLMKRAETQGKQQAQQRGLLNSSMAAGAAQGAMIDRAQPFAMQDSNNLIQNAQRNTQAQNERGLLQAGLIGNSYQSNQNYAQQMGLNEQAYGFESQMAEQQQGYQQDNMQLGSELDQKQMELSQALEQGNMELANSLQRDINEQQAGIQASRDERLSGYDQDMQRLSAELREAQAGNDFERTQQLESQRADIQSQRDEQLFSYDMQNTERQADIQAQRDARLQEFDQESARLSADLQEAQAANDFERTEEITERQAQIQESRDKLMFAQDMESMAEEYGLRDELAQSESQRAMEELFATSTANGWGVMADNLTDIVGQYGQQIERIQMNPDIEEGDKTAMIDEVLAMRDTDIGFQKSMYQELPNYLTNTGSFPDRTQRELTGIYQEELGRDPDQSGMDYYSGLINSGRASIGDVAQRIQNSPEAQNR